MNPSQTLSVSRSSGLPFALGVFLVIAGLIAILLPVILGVAITLAIGWIILLSGVVHFLLAWKRHSFGGTIWELLLGAIYFAAGLYLIIHPLVGLTSLTLLLAVYLFSKGLIEVIHYFQLQPRFRASWLLINGVINLILAVLIWQSWPFSSVWAIGTLIGFSILFTGFSRVMLSRQASPALRV